MLKQLHSTKDCIILKKKIIPYPLPSPYPGLFPRGHQRYIHSIIPPPFSTANGSKIRHYFVPCLNRLSV